MISPKTRIIALAAIAMLAFAGNSLLTRFALANGEIGAAPFTLIRLGSGAITLAVLAAGTNRRWRPGRADLVGAASLATYMVCFSFAYLSIGAATGALVLFGAVQLTIFVGSFLSGVRPTLVEWTGATIALVGLGALVSPSGSGGSILALALMAMAGLGWGINTLAGRGAKDALAYAARNLTLATLMVSPLLFVVGEGRVSGFGIFLAVAAGALSSGIGYAIWYAVVPHLTRTTTGVLQLLVPPMTAVIAVPLLSEPVGWRFAGLSAVILAGVLMTILAKRAA